MTRGLEEALDDDELAAVVAHEIAHIKNGDIRLMAAANVLMEILVLVQRRNVLGGVGWKKALVLVFMPALLLVFGAAGVATRVAFTIAPRLPPPDLLVARVHRRRRGGPPDA